MRNVAIGGNTMLNNTNGGDNVAIGDRALFNNTAAITTSRWAPAR